MSDQPTVSDKVESEVTSARNVWFVALSGFFGVVLGLAGLLNWRFLTGELPRELVSQAGQLFTLVMLINFATSFGIPMVVVQFAGNRSENSAKIFRLALKVTGISTFVASVLVMYVSNAGFTFCISFFDFNSCGLQAFSIRSIPNLQFASFMHHGFAFCIVVCLECGCRCRHCVRSDDRSFLDDESSADPGAFTI